MLEIHRKLLPCWVGRNDVYIPNFMLQSLSDKISYKVSEDVNGKMSGYGYAESGEWVNFNPNFGGVKINSDGVISGWAFGQKSEWINFNFEKNISSNDLQNEISSAKTVTNNDDLASVSTASLLDSLCNKILPASDCNLIK